MSLQVIGKAAIDMEKFRTFRKEEREKAKEKIKNVGQRHCGKITSMSTRIYFGSQRPAIPIFTEVLTIAQLIVSTKKWKLPCSIWKPWDSHGI